MNSPSGAVEEFVDAWSEQDFDRLLGACQPSWRIGRNEAGAAERDMDPDTLPPSHQYITQGVPNIGYTARERLINWFEDVSLQHAEVLDEIQEVDIEVFSDVMVDVPVEVIFKDQFGKTHHQKRLFRVICENNTGQPTPEGEWSVNPVSVMRQS